MLLRNIHLKCGIVMFTMSSLIMKKDSVSTFHDELNSIDPHISFTIEHEIDGYIAFFDTCTFRFHAILALLQLTSSANLYTLTDTWFLHSCNTFT